MRRIALSFFAFLWIFASNHCAFALVLGNAGMQESCPDSATESESHEHGRPCSLSVLPANKLAPTAIEQNTSTPELPLQTLSLFIAETFDFSKPDFVQNLTNASENPKTFHLQYFSSLPAAPNAPPLS